MAMRITNKIMQDNSLNNINTNKILQDKLATQMATGKKINRPSDDPVIAIRALRLRTTLSDVTQYRDKNVEDADSWLTITEDSINTLTEVITDMIEQCNKGVNQDLTTQNRAAILEDLKALRDQIYASGDADYAGRGVFTGYRTGVKLRFQTDTTEKYEIKESVTKAALDDIEYIKLNSADCPTGIDGVNAGNYNDNKLHETDIYSTTVHRLRLSYDDLDADSVPVITYYDGNAQAASITAEVISKYDTTQDPYLELVGETGDRAIFIPETGELILSDSLYKKLSSTSDDVSTRDVDEGQITITYNKTNWKKDDLRPEHYFECTETTDQGVTIHHNDPADQDAASQIISYDVGFNQAIRVNTLANECYTHDIGRDVDDLINTLETLSKVEEAMNALEGVLQDVNLPEADRLIAEDNLAAATKAYEMYKEKMKNSFSSCLTRMQNHLQTATLALTNVGTRSTKVDLVKTRLSSQKTNFKDLVADNEQADTAEVATDLASAKLAYDAALMATGKIAQSSLMNYI